MLLTSSQVSVLITSSIVVLCTAALFFSGYAIQQRTLRDLRRAIKPREPRPSPKIYLPEYFQKPTTELEDGTTVEIDDPRLGRSHDADEDDIVIVRPTIPDESEQQKPLAPEKKHAAGARVEAQNDRDGATNEQKPMSRAERRRQIKEDIRRLSAGQEPVYYQRRLW
ncbi:hypothetical protein F4677DRAFT_410312 [Hypoxylon crocopeplum]|nr:hypothetical protein F4677DRAFT_410312 [Hypoxylon crocopeplum]